MAIVFKDADSVEVDGSNAGDIVSVIANYPTRKNEILKAFKDFRKSEKDEANSKVAAAETTAAAKDAEREAALEAKEREHEADRAELENSLASILTELGNEPAVKARIREARLARIRAEKKRLEEEEAAL